jgi:hypothetical protein
MHPDHSFALMILGGSCTHAGRYEESIAAFGKLATLMRRAPVPLSWLGWAYGAAGRRGQALNIARELEERAEREFVSPITLAWIHCGLDEGDEAFRWLEMAFEQRTPFLVYNKLLIPEKIRLDPRFHDLARRMKLPL